ncbi:discoidin domain-containing protein [Lachnospiraceae bacterium 46-15]
MKCANCGSELPEGAAFCGECGTKVMIPENGMPSDSFREDIEELSDAAPKKPLPRVYKALIAAAICVAVGIVVFAVRLLYFSDSDKVGKVSESTYKETDKTGITDTEDSEAADEKNSDGQKAPRQVSEIDKRYQEMKEAVSSGLYEQITFGDGIAAYYDDGELRLTGVSEDVDGVLYDCFYYYEDEQLFYAHYAGEDEYKFYFEGDKLIWQSHITDTGTVESSDGQDADKADEYAKRGKEVLSAGRSYMIDKRVALRLAASAGGTDAAPGISTRGADGVPETDIGDMGSVPETDVGDTASTWETDSGNTDSMPETDAVPETTGIETYLPGIRMEDVTEVSASSSLFENNMAYEAELITDGEAKTAWIEGASGQGVGESVTLYFNSTYKVTGFNIHAGYHESKSAYRKYSRPKKIYVEFSDGSGETFVLKDKFKEQDIQLPHSVDTEYVTITVESVYPGSEFDNMAISEIALY